MTEAPFNWKQPAGKALEFALNRALALDEDTRAALRGLDGQRDFVFERLAVFAG